MNGLVYGLIWGIAVTGVALVVATQIVPERALNAPRTASDAPAPDEAAEASEAGAGIDATPEGAAGPAPETLPEPGAESEPETAAEPAAEAEPEPAVEPEPEAAIEPAAEPEPEPAVEPEPEAAAEPAAETLSEPTPEARPGPAPSAEAVILEGGTAPEIDELPRPGRAGNATARQDGSAARIVPPDAPADMPGTGAEPPAAMQPPERPAAPRPAGDDAAAETAEPEGAEATSGGDVGAVSHTDGAVEEAGEPLGDTAGPGAPVEAADAPAEPVAEDAADLVDTAPDPAPGAASTPGDDAPAAEDMPRASATAEAPEAGSDPDRAAAILPPEQLRPGARVVSDRLPQIGAAPQDGAPVEDAPEAPEATGIALIDHAAGFDAPAGAALMAVILVDRPGAAIPRGLPVTLALPPGDGAAARAQDWRDAGGEVAAMPDLPRGATPQDVEVALAGALDLVPGAATVLPAPEGWPQGAALTQAITVLARTGHGLVGRGQGLDAALRIAAQSDVPHARLFRVVDGEGRDARAIGRFLDQAAFEARRTGSVVVLARAEPETLDALDRWIGSSGAEGVTLAPVSAVIARGAGGD
ncbi:hypothetical protein E2L08_09795 [Palleronia sediminis]|uniref:Divergent polysaccharide deacetylase n=1 Tax=Palleronia sediminis TaxID=2547833 RepID=A0A4R6A9L5_9RHOB|nr:divergent polysaccharide deacetylase family protein [Palleronia sediminis]TDL79585.1 hypothetical protein E2L08_09795 [Palleronia sediminis]